MFLLLSVVFMGLGHLALGTKIYVDSRGMKTPKKSWMQLELYQLLLIKGVCLGGIEIIFLLNRASIAKSIYNLITLGTVTGEKLMKNNDHSIFLMAQGLIIFIIVVMFVFIYIYSIVDLNKAIKKSKFQAQHRTGISSLLDRSFPYVVLTPIALLIIFFVLFPLLFSCLLAFTNYSMPYHMPPKNLVDWVGFENFKSMFTLPNWKNAFIGVFSWNVIWAFAATFLNFFVGLFLALLLYDKDIKFSKGFRTLLLLPYAVPQMVSLLVWRNLLNGQFGPINMTLKAMGVIEKSIPFLSDPTIARVSVILVNLWIGAPYFMLLLTGILTSIPKTLYEAAEIDGASGYQRFKKITLPMVFFATAPLLVMTFSFNFNNFGAVYFLTGGGPDNVYPPGSGAGATDILITWIFELMNRMQKYNMAAVLSLLVFALIAPFAIYNFTRTKSFKDGDF